MKKLVVIGFLMSAALVGCGGKSKASGTTTPDNKGGSTEMKSGATGGATYGEKGAAPAPSGGASADPCAGGQ